jgi:hypothetical protein
MKIKVVLFCITIFIFCGISLKAQKSETEPWNYIINIELNDSSLLVNLNIKITKTKTGQKDFLLFNRYIQIEEALLDDEPLIFTRSNDTLRFETFQKKEMTFFMKYRIPCSLTESSKVIASYSDSIYAYPVLFDTSQIFCERFNKWYPVLYDNFAYYEVTTIVPKTHKVFAYYPESNCKEMDGKNYYSFSCYDEDFPFFITPINIFHQHKVIQHNNICFEFYFLPRLRRLVSIKENKPFFVTDSTQIDSLLNISINRSIAAIEWYNANLWPKEIKNLSFVETGILGLGAGLGSFVLMDRMLMNMEAIENYALSHELSHIWLGIHTEYLAKGKFFMGESIPEYINLMFYESWAGNDAFEKAIQDKINLTLFEVPFYTVTFEQVLNQKKGDSQADEIIYHKGVVFVHEFQKMIGKDKLLKIVRETYSVPNHFVTLKDFENSVKANDCWNEYLKLYEIEL